MRNISVSAISTEIGKTCICAMLCKAFGYDYFKVIQAGEMADSKKVKSLSPNTKIYKEGVFLKTPASPHLGKKIEKLDYDGLKIPLPSEDNLLVEIAGGLYSPMDEKNFMIDYLAFNDLPTFLVINYYLGSINHTILSIEALKNKNIEILGIISSNSFDKESDEFLKNHFKDLNFFYAKDINEKDAHINLKEQIISKGVRL